MIHKTLSFKGCQPAGSRRCWKEEWSRREQRQSTRKLCRDFSRCSLSVELLDAPKVWNVPNLWLLLEILMVIFRCRRLGGDITVPLFSVRPPQLGWDGASGIQIRIGFWSPVWCTRSSRAGAGFWCQMWLNESSRGACSTWFPCWLWSVVWLSCSELDFPVFLDEHPKDQKSHPQQQLAPAPPFRWGSLWVKLELW